MKKQLLIIATLDTKGREAGYVKDCVLKLGVNPVIMDIGVVGEPQIQPDITNAEVTEAAGYDLKELIKLHDRPRGIMAIQEGGRILANRLLQEGKLDGVIGLGGGTGTSVTSFIMRSLPFGLPKIIVSTMASRDVREYVGTKDIVMFHSVADLLGFNEFIRLVLDQASHAVCGMMKVERSIERLKPIVGVTAYGPTSHCAVLAESLLYEKGYQMMGFHTNGCGGMAMEEMIAEGLIAGVMEITPHEIADEMMSGYCKGIGPSRLETAGIMGIPVVFAPGGLDNVAFGPSCPMPEELAGRNIYGHDHRICVRLDSSEMQKLASTIAEKLNKAPESTYVLIPTKGWSEGDRAGMPLFDLATDRIFTEKLKKLLNPQIPVEEMDVHINELSFAQRAVDVLDGMIKKRRSST
ncbi:MAG: Tm-1-like ATP-binding domain-containing protein [Proteobacteria bacterium]|nr:Tm-1-like ATP-binding domain-containing protein [Pseudomonadota bacterium]